MGFQTYNGTHTITPCLETWLPYLTIHQCLDVIENKSRIRVQSSTDERGPYGLSAATQWDEKGLNMMLRDISFLHESWKMAFIKLNSTMVRGMDSDTENAVVEFCNASQ